MADTQNQSDVQTLLSYFEKLLGTFKALIWISGIAITIISGFFVVLLFANKEEAKDKVLEAQTNAAKEITETRSWAKLAIEEVKSDAENDIQDAGKEAQREINNIKFVARQRVTEEVDKFIKSSEIQNEIDRRVREEIEQNYVEYIAIFGEIDDAVSKMRLDDFGSMLELLRLSRESDSAVIRDYASERLNIICSELMNLNGTFDNDEPFYKEPKPDAIKIDQENQAKGDGILNRIEKQLKIVEQGGQPGLRTIIVLVRNANHHYGLNYTVCEYQELMKFLRNYKD